MNLSPAERLFFLKGDKQEGDILGTHPNIYTSSDNLLLNEQFFSKVRPLNNVDSFFQTVLIPEETYDVMKNNLGEGSFDLKTILTKLGRPLVVIPGRAFEKTKGQGDLTYSTTQSYVGALIKSGALPVVVYPTEDLPVLDPKGDKDLFLKAHHEDIGKKVDLILSIAGGVVVAGGPDIFDACYEEITWENTAHSEFDASEKIMVLYDHFRDALEIALAKASLEKEAGNSDMNLPLLGICRGSQIIAVAAGHSLVKSIVHEVPDAEDHLQVINGVPSDPTEVVHSLSFKKKSHISKILGKESILTNSFHHQSVKLDASRNHLVVSGINNQDRVPEVIELSEESKHTLKDAEVPPFVIGVQSHPEFLFNKVPEWINVFKEFSKVALKRQNALLNSSPEIFGSIRFNFRD